MNKQMLTDRKYQAIAYYSVVTMARILSQNGLELGVPAHGVSNITITAITYEPFKHRLVLHICSPDIPDYVAYHTVMEDLKIVGGLPLVELEFEDKREKKENKDEQSGD